MNRANGERGRAIMHKRLDPAELKPALSPKEAERMITKNLPPIDHHHEVVEEVGVNSIRVRLPFRQEFMGTEPWQDGSGRVFSDPMVMGFADTAMYCCVMGAMGPRRDSGYGEPQHHFSAPGPHCRLDCRGADRASRGAPLLSRMLAHV
jgi:acyl-coenzyme A thioesterase PaaI-like protein